MCVCWKYVCYVDEDGDEVFEMFELVIIYFCYVESEGILFGRFVLVGFVMVEGECYGQFILFGILS